MYNLYMRTRLYGHMRTYSTYVHIQTQNALSLSLFKDNRYILAAGTWMHW